jgi:FG-GAP-like repeat/FG-GAP repeat
LKSKASRVLFVSAILSITQSCALLLWAAPAATTTSLTIYSGANTVVSGGSIPSGTAVMLAAMVKAGAVGVSPGQVNFCDASAVSCTDIHLLGTAQLVRTDPGAGMAFFELHPGIGSYNYKAVFVGTPNGTTQYVGSSSTTVPLTVTGIFPTKTSIAGSGDAGNYSLTATVTGLTNGAGVAAPSGTVSFPDTSNGNNSLGSAALGTATRSFSFGNPNNLLTGGAPNRVAAGDFNGDGIPDLVTTNSESDTLTILLGDGDGNFTEPAGGPIPTGSDPSFAIIGDFNSDGKLDLGVTNFNDSTVTIQLGNGDGTFIEAADSPVAVGRGPLSLAVGDFNGDGIADLATANTRDDSVTILLGNGDGTFVQASSSPMRVFGSSPASVAAADFNRDGRLDLVVAVVGPNNVSILLGNGDGTFTEAANSPVPVGLTPYSLAVGDFNGDGIPDLVTANDASVNGNPGSVTILLGAGNGGFTEASGSPIPVGINPLIVAAGDFNGDDKVDLAVTNESDNSVAILLGNGDGTFSHAPSVHTPAGLSPLSVATADFNGDGAADLAVTETDSLNGNAVMVLLAQNTQSAMATVSGISPTGAGTHQVQASYPGDSLYASSDSTSVGLIGGPAPGFSVSGTAVTVADGGTKGSTITLTPAGGFTGSVNLSASITSGPSGARHPPTLSFGSTTPVSIAGSGSATATLTISTTPATTAAAVPVRRMGESNSLATGSAALAFILFSGVAARRRKWLTLIGMLTLLAAFAGGLAACGGSTGTMGVGNDPGTTPGTYTITVTGSSGATTASGTITLTVQ